MIEKSHTTAKETPRAAVIHVEFPLDRGEEVPAISRSVEAKLQEAVNLTEALAVDLEHSEAVVLKKVNPKFVIGAGRVEDFSPLWEAKEIDLVIMNCRLTPAQQRNLEVAWDVKVIDRTHLILEIFAGRARTKAGRLQVALAQQNYQQGRLVRAWTHLERQRGGMSKTGGPGERQIELDRRMIRDKIIRIKSDLSSIEKERAQQRAGRKKSGIPVVSLVGYTNAGKSTLFNAIMNAVTPLEEEEAMVKDMLFATLDPLMRKVKLPSTREVIISDTVGFVSDLPHELVESFKSTLEEVCMSDLLLHVHDSSSEDVQPQAQDVETVLKSINANEIPVLHVANKCDLAVQDEVEGVQVSALENKGIDGLLQLIEDTLGADEQIKDIKLFAGDGKRLAWLHQNAQVLEENYDDEGKMLVKVKISEAVYNQFSKV